MKNKKGWLSILFFGIVLLLASTVMACSQPAVVNETNETEELEGYPVYVSSLTRKLNSEVMQGALIPFLTKYPISHAQYYDEPIPVQEFHFGMGGNLGMASEIPAESVSKAKEHIDNATSLLKWGRLPDEIESRPLDKSEVIEELEDAKSLLEEQWSWTFTWEQSDLEWAQQHDSIEINNERTFEDINKKYKKYRQALATIISELDHILSRLPNAIED